MAVFDRRELLQIADKMLDEVADFIFTKSQENIIDAGLVNEGMLLRSGFIERNFLNKSIGYSVPYAIVHEYGTDPFFPPIEPLQRWASQKLGLTEKEARRAAFAIATNISKYGLEPKSFMRDAISAAKAKYGGN